MHANTPSSDKLLFTCCVIAFLLLLCHMQVNALTTITNNQLSTISSWSDDEFLVSAPVFSVNYPLVISNAIVTFSGDVLGLAQLTIQGTSTVRFNQSSLIMSKPLIVQGDVTLTSADTYWNGITFNSLQSLSVCSESGEHKSGTMISNAKISGVTSDITSSASAITVHGTHLNGCLFISNSRISAVDMAVNTLDDTLVLVSLVDSEFSCSGPKHCVQSHQLIATSSIFSSDVGDCLQGAVLKVTHSKFRGGTCIKGKADGNSEIRHNTFTGCDVPFYAPSADRLVFERNNVSSCLDPLTLNDIGQTLIRFNTFKGCSGSLKLQLGSKCEQSILHVVDVSGNTFTEFYGEPPTVIIHEATGVSTLYCTVNLKENTFKNNDVQNTTVLLETDKVTVSSNTFMNPDSPYDVELKSGVGPIVLSGNYLETAKTKGSVVVENSLTTPPVYVTCFGMFHNEDEVCNGHGTCQAINDCSCIDGYSGPMCQILPPPEAFTVAFDQAQALVPSCGSIKLKTVLSRPIPGARYHWTSEAIGYPELNMGPDFYLIAMNNYSQFDTLEIIDQLWISNINYKISVNVTSPDGYVASAAHTFMRQPYPASGVVVHYRSPPFPRVKQPFSVSVGVKSASTPCISREKFKWVWKMNGQLLYEQENSSSHLVVFEPLFITGGVYNFTVEMQMLYQNISGSLDFNVTFTKAVAVINGTSTAKLYEPVRLTGAKSYDPEGTDRQAELFLWSCDYCMIDNATSRDPNITFTKLGANIVTLAYTPDRSYLERNATTTFQVTTEINPFTLSVDPSTPTSINICSGITLKPKYSRTLYNATYEWSVVSDSSMLTLVGFIQSMPKTLPELALFWYALPLNATPTIRLNATEPYFSAIVDFTFKVSDFKNVELVVEGTNGDSTSVGTAQYINSHSPLHLLAGTRSTVTPCVSEAAIEWVLNGKAATIAKMPYNFVANYFEAGGTFEIGVSARRAKSSLAIDAIISVIVQKPVVSIQGGDKTVKVGEQFTVAPGLSYDPEVTTPLTNECFEWVCAGCNITNPTSKVTTVSVYSDGLYSLSLFYQPNCAAPRRNATATVYFKAVREALPIPSITTALPPVINSQQRTKIEATVDNLEGMLKGEMIFYWTIKTNTTIVKEYAGTTRLQPLVIKANELLDGTAYEFNLRAKYISSIDIEINYASTSIYSRTATSPVVTSYSIYPTAGNVLVTNFQVNCSGVNINMDPAMLFRVEVFDPAVNTFSVIRPFTNSDSISALLPLGHGSNYQLQVRCVLRNIYGYEAYSVKNITVSPISTTNVTETVEQLKTIVNANNTGNDLSTVVQTVDTVSQAIKKANNTKQIEQVQAVVESILDQMLTANQSSVSAESMETEVNALEVLSRSDLISSKATIAAFAILNNTLSTISRGAASTKVVNTAAKFASNMLINKATDDTVKNSAPNVITAVRQAVVSDLSVSQDETVIATDAFDLSVKLDYGSNLQNLTITSTSNNTVSLPTVDALSTQETYAYEMVLFKNGVNPYNFGNDSSSSVLSFKVLSNGEKVDLSELKEPISIQLEIEQVIPSNETDNYRHYCAYWDGGESWDTYGCWLHAQTETHIICHCNHTTSFASFILYDPKEPNKSSTGLYIASIVFNSVFALTSFSLLVLSVYFRKDQPMRSRYLVPFIGLSAILFESVIQGVIRNSLLIAAKEVADYKAINVLSFILMVVVNPIVLVSLFIFFYQQLRYFFMNNLYAIMNADGKNTTIIRIYRLLTSKVLFFGFMVLIWVATFAYYVIFMSLHASTTMSALAATSVNAISYTAMAFVLAVLIVSAFMWDSIVIVATKIRKAIAKMDENQEQNEDVAVEKKIASNTFNAIKNHFTRDDPLLFRAESVFMAIAMIVLIVSYSLGLSDRYAGTSNAPNAPIKVFQAIFDWIYISFRIASFGGFTLISYLILQIRSKRSLYKTLKDTDSDKEQADVLEQILADEQGYALIKDYCRKEYSVENCLLYEEIVRLRSENLILNPSERSLCLDRMSALFVEKGSEFEVNISNKVKVSFEELLASDDISAEQVENVMMLLHGEMIKNLSDTFVRFCTTAEYENYQAFRRMHQELASVGSFATTTKVE